MTKIYKYTDDTWVDGSDDCSCCSGLTFECYNAVDWTQNGSADTIHQLYSDVLLDYTFDGDIKMFPDGNPYTYLTLQELKDICDRQGIVLEEVV